VISFRRSHSASQPSPGAESAGPASMCTSTAGTAQNGDRGAKGVAVRDPWAARDPGSRPRVVVADDDPTLREAACDLLEDLGCDVVARAQNGSQAIGLTEQFLPDAVLMDVRMPVVDGLQATRAIRVDKLLDVAVLLFSAAEDSHLVDDAIASGGICCLTKGTAPAVIMDLVLQACEDVRSSPPEREPSGGMAAWHRDVMTVR
jgi:CheY-like chemotaxis protein